MAFNKATLGAWPLIWPAWRYSPLRDREKSKRAVMVAHEAAGQTGLSLSPLPNHYRNHQPYALRQ